MPGVAPARFPEAPRYLGLCLIFCGVVALLISIWQYQWGLRYLWGGNFAAIAGAKRGPCKRRCSAVAIALAFIGAIRFLRRGVSFRVAAQERGNID